MKKVEVSELMYILYEFIYDKLVEDDCKINEVLDFDYEEITKPLLINNDQYTEIEYRFNLPITNKCEPFSLNIIIPDNNYEVYNSNLDSYSFYIDTINFINKIIDNIPYCSYLKEFANKLVLLLILNKDNYMDSMEEEIYDLLLGIYQPLIIEKINDKYTFAKKIGKN